MRFISAAPRGVTANRRSSATTPGLRRNTASSACTACASVKASTSPPIDDTRCCAAGRRSEVAITIVQVSTAVSTLEDLGVLKRPPADFHLADDVFLRHRSPVAAVGAVVAVIAHDEVIALLHDLRAP